MNDDSKRLARVVLDTPGLWTVQVRDDPMSRWRGIAEYGTLETAEEMADYFHGCRVRRLEMHAYSL